MQYKSFVFAGVIAVLCMLHGGKVSATTVVTTVNGTWTAYPGQQTTYQTSVQQPINADGSSTFKYNAKSVIPVKFGLSTGIGPFVFESIVDANPATYPYSFLEFDPTDYSNT